MKKEHEIREELAIAETLYESATKKDGGAYRIFVMIGRVLRIYPPAVRAIDTAIDRFLMKGYIIGLRRSLGERLPQEDPCEDLLEVVYPLEDLREQLWQRF